MQEGIYKPVSHEERAKRRDEIKAEGQRLKGLLNNNELLCHLSEKYNVSPSTVTKIVSDMTMNVEERAARRYNIAQEAAVLSGTYPKADIVNKLASEFGVSIATVHKALKEHSIELKYLPKPKVVKKAQNRSIYMEKAVFEGISNGYTVNELAAKLDCTRENVYRYYRRLIKDGKLQVAADTAIRRKKSELLEKRNSSIDKIMELHSQSYNVDQIAVEIGLPVHMVSSVIQQNSPLTTKSTFKHLKYKWLTVIADLFNPELSVGEIAAKHGKFSSCISQLIIDCKSIGIPLPERKDGRTR